MNFRASFTTFLVIFAIMCSLSNQVSLQEDLTITYKQKEILDKFRALVGSRLPHAYMNKDIYLIRWLRARKFNIRGAETMLMENLKWREENKIDNILEEDWSDFSQQYQADIQGCDLEGRPTVSVPVGDWDVRSAVVSGKTQRMMRYFDKLFEEVSTYIRTSQEKGENMTQYNFIFDLSRFNLILQGCPLCVPVYAHFFLTYENHYPGNTHSTTVVNAPQIFLPLWQILRSLLSQATTDTITLYGRDKSEWKSALLKSSHPSQLTTEFGGTKEEPFTLEELRVDGGHFQCSKYANR